MVKKKQEIEPQKLALDALNATVMDNKAMIHQSRANIEENRLLILSNQSAAALGNQQLANHNTEEIFESRKTVLVTFDPDTELQEKYSFPPDSSSLRLALTGTSIMQIKSRMTMHRRLDCMD